MTASLVLARGVEVVMGASSTLLEDLTFRQELPTNARSIDFAIIVSVPPEEAPAP